MMPYDIAVAFAAPVTVLCSPKGTVRLRDPHFNPSEVIVIAPSLSQGARIRCTWSDTALHHVQAVRQRTFGSLHARCIDSTHG